MPVRKYSHGFAMSLAIANLSQIALYENAITSWLFLAKFPGIRLYRFYSANGTTVALDRLSPTLFAALGTDSKITSMLSHSSSLPYAVLFVLAATEVFKELHCERRGLRSLIRHSVLNWQLVGILIGVSALFLDEKRWGTKEFDCLALVWMEALCCTRLAEARASSGNHNCKVRWCRLQIESADLDARERSQVRHHVNPLAETEEREPLQKQLQMLMFLTLFEIAVPRPASARDVTDAQEKIVRRFKSSLSHCG